MMFNDGMGERLAKYGVTVSFGFNDGSCRCDKAILYRSIGGLLLITRPYGDWESPLISSHIEVLICGERFTISRHFILQDNHNAFVYAFIDFNEG